MKPKNLFIVSFFCMMFMFMFVSNSFCQYNMVRNWLAQKPVTNETDIISNTQTVQDVIQTTQYIDGLGRTVQSVSKKTSPLQKDAVDMSVYDNLGREVRKYLPFVSNVTQAGDITDDGNYKPTAVQQQLVFNQNQYPGENNFYYSQVNFENSPQSRVLNSYSQGNSWVGSSKGTKAQSLANTLSDNIQIWNISLTQGNLPISAGAYLPGQLYKTISFDENNLQVIVYKDKDGHVILKKSQLTAVPDPGTGSQHAGWLCTYYVYDDYGNMRFIITPKVVSLIDGTWSISQNIADELCYRYEYDLLSRVIIEKGPGTPSGSLGEVWSVFDLRGRIVMTQNGNQRVQQKWQYFQYDNLDRPVATGLISDPVNYANLTFHQNNAATVSINPSYPNLSLYATEQFSQTYYDSYSWVGGTGLSSSLDQTNTSNNAYFYTPTNSSYPYPQPIVQTKMMRGLPTGTKTEVLGSNGSLYLYTVSFYDDNGRRIQTQGTNITGGVDKITTQFSWSGATLRILEEQNKNSGITQTHKILTKRNYSNQNRLQSVTKTISSIINSSPVITINGIEKTISTYTYNELGQLKNKTLGIHPTLSTPLETLTYDYNVRGWLTGINKNFTQNGNNANYFGEELGYDKTSTANGTTTYTNPAINGNIGGLIWKTKGDGVPRKYDFTYTNANQLSSANFQQNTPAVGSVWDKTYVDYSVNNISYDLNGNIKTLNQNGFVLGGAPNIDNLSYNYTNSDNSNKLLNVIDNANNPSSKLGDFHYTGAKTILTTDYGYDANGNQVLDNNKNISSIVYNSLNLPSIITVAGKGTISFTYDAAGNKIKKQTLENNVSIAYSGGTDIANINTITTYIGGSVYFSKTFTTSSLNQVFINYLNTLNVTEALQSVAHEEGRARIVYPTTGQPPYYAFDYFIRDHLGNIRVTLTDELKNDIYLATTLETGGIGTELTFYNIKNDPNHVIDKANLTWWGNVVNNTYNNNNNIPFTPDPTINPLNSSSKVYKLTGGTGGDRYGLGISLKVMAGDFLNVYGKSIWHSNGAAIDNSTHTIVGVLASFINDFAGTSAVINGGHGTTGSVLNGNSNVTGPLSTWLTSGVQPPAQGPKGYINWIFFDEQFKPVAFGNGFDPISGTADNVKSHSITGIPVPKNGYVYIYCSNESNQDIYFDNLQVVQNRGPLLEERHYYPDGLTMFGLNSMAFGKLPNNFGYQGKEIQNNEFYDGTGLEEYDFESRYYDPQLGRWWTQDPASQFPSPYNAMGNNWPNRIDPDGRWAGWDDVIVSVIGFAVGYVSSGLTTKDWGWKSVKSGFLSAVMFELGYYSAGASSGISQGGIANIFSSGGFQAQANTVGLAFAGKSALVSAVGSLMPGINIPIGNNFSIGISPGLALSGGSITGSINISASYTNGDFAISGGINASGSSFSWGGSAMYDGFGGSYAHNSFNGEHSQVTATLGVYAFGASLRVDEDYLGDGKDRWRTGGIEFGIKNFVFGLSVYSNDGKVESDEQTHEGVSPLWGRNKKGEGAWNNGQVFHSPAWIGFRNGNQVSRIGYSHKEVQDFFQNGLHQSWFPTPYYLNYDNFTRGVYSYTGFYNPFTLY